MSKHNPERRAWRGRSHKRHGARVRDLRDRELRADIVPNLSARDPDAVCQMAAQIGD